MEGGLMQWRSGDCCHASERHRAPASTRQQPPPRGWSQNGPVAVLMWWLTVMLHLCSAGRLRPPIFTSHITRPDVLCRLIAGCMLCSALWYVDRSASYYIQAIDNKPVVTGGLTTARQAYCLAFAPNSLNLRKSFHRFQKFVRESSPTGLQPYTWTIK